MAYFQQQLDRPSLFGRGIHAYMRGSGTLCKQVTR